MLSRTIRRSILDSKISSSALPPTFLLPLRARCFNTTTQHIETPSAGLDASQMPLNSVAASAEDAVKPKGPPRRKAPTAPAPITTPMAVDSSVKEMLPLLAVQPSHYINVHIHGKPYLVTQGGLCTITISYARGYSRGCSAIEQGFESGISRLYAEGGTVSRREDFRVQSYGHRNGGRTDESQGDEKAEEQENSYSQEQAQVHDLTDLRSEDQAVGGH